MGSYCIKTQKTSSVFNYVLPNGFINRNDRDTVSPCALQFKVTSIKSVPSIENIFNRSAETVGMIVLFVHHLSWYCFAFYNHLLFTCAL